MKKLSIILLCSMSFMGAAIAANPNDTMPSPKPMSEQTPTSGEGMPSADWQGKQWDKNQWDAMTPSEKTEYKTRHNQWWNSMTPSERDSMREKHKGGKNYMDDKWDQSNSVHDPQRLRN